MPTRSTGRSTMRSRPAHRLTWPSFAPALRSIMSASGRWNVRARVISSFHDHSTIDEPTVQAETDRYIANPGQALGYKIGQLTISRLRTHAQDELGTAFDLRAFHDEVLGAGALPLDLLERRIDAWIARRKGAPAQAHGRIAWPIRGSSSPMATALHTIDSAFGLTGSAAASRALSGADTPAAWRRARCAGTAGSPCGPSESQSPERSEPSIYPPRSG
jgi:hypothetical protein